jgi:hypothetical protein
LPEEHLPPNNICQQKVYGQMFLLINNLVGVGAGAGVRIELSISALT